MICNSRGVDEEQFEVDSSDPPAHREGGDRGEHQGFLHLLPLLPLGHLQGHVLAEQLTAFYPDLLDERFVSNFAVYHQRYSTNTFPTWHLAPALPRHRP
jgi:glutamate synthase (NADPH/NADH) large chain